MMHCKHCGKVQYRLLPIAPLPDDSNSHVVWFMCLACNLAQTEVISTDRLLLEQEWGNVMITPAPVWQYKRGVDK
jgi:hypothetical protein